MKSLSHNLLALAVLATVSANAFADDAKKPTDAAAAASSDAADATKPATPPPSLTSRPHETSKANTAGTKGKDGAPGATIKTADDVARVTSDVKAVGDNKDKKLGDKATATSAVKSDGRKAEAHQDPAKKLATQPDTGPKSAPVAKDAAKPAHVNAPAPAVSQKREVAPAPKTRQQLTATKQLARPTAVPKGPMQYKMADVKDLRTLTAHADRVAPQDPRIQAYIRNYNSHHPGPHDTNLHDDVNFRARLTLFLSLYEAKRFDELNTYLTPQGVLVDGLPEETIATVSDCADCGHVYNSPANLPHLPDAALPAEGPAGAAGPVGDFRAQAPPGGSRALPVLVPAGPAEAVRPVGPAPVVINAPTSDTVAPKLNDVFAQPVTTSPLGLANGGALGMNENELVMTLLRVLLAASAGGQNQNIFGQQPGLFNQPNMFNQPLLVGQQNPMQWYAGWGNLGSYRTPAPGFGGGFGGGLAGGFGGGFGGGPRPLLGLGGPTNFNGGGLTQVGSLGGAYGNYNTIGGYSGQSSPAPAFAPYVGGTSGLGALGTSSLGTGLRTGSNPAIVPYAARQVGH